MNDMDIYFTKIKRSLDKAYSLAQIARKKGFDPVSDIEIPLAENMAERVVGLITSVKPDLNSEKLIQRIFELEEKYGLQDWRVAMEISLETAKSEFCDFDDIKEAMEVGIRVGIAYLTNGVVASPLEGFTKLGIKKRKDGEEYFSLYFSGPIRSAGGTAASVSVIVADYVRKKMGYKEYDPTEEEIKRMFTELRDYHERITNLQYFPTEEETIFLVKNLPVQIDGDPSEKFEVSNYKNLPRIETNRIRNGICLVIGEGLAQKAGKVYRKFSNYMKDFDMEHWSFLDGFVEIQSKIKSKEEKKSSELIKADYTYIKDLVAGRPVLTYPLREGGFRLRYGRARNSGFSSDAIHPATMLILNNYIASGTQLKTERPGKATTIAVCDDIDGPVVKLNNGSVLCLAKEDDAIKNKDDIDEILYLGDILVNYGDFLDRGHRLVPCGYNEEWYRAELLEIKEKDEIVDRVIKDRFSYLTAKESILIAKKYNVPLHPKYTYYWNSINKKKFLILREWINEGQVKDDKLILDFIYDATKDIEDRDAKRVLELLAVPHIVKENKVIIEKDHKEILLSCLNFDKEVVGDDVLEIVNNLSGIKIRDKSGTFIGARMGRPEKAKMRKMTGSPHGLFPVGNEGGKMRNFLAAMEKGKVTSEFAIYYCDGCKKETIYSICEFCGSNTKRAYYCYDCKDVLVNECEIEGHRCVESRNKPVDINYYFKKALKNIGLNEYTDIVKGVRGMSSAHSIPENLIKSILRSKNKIYVNKDGTTRFDMTEMTITAFKPKEIGVSVEKLKEMGYDEDINGNELINEEQLLNLKVQDVILPSCPESLDEGADSVLFRVSKFIDELLLKLYNVNSFYNLKDRKDLVGHLIVAMSPHTSAGIVGRVIGFSETQGFLAHPLFHSIMRRDCDGDEACVILLMDALLNFSRKFLPSHRGTTQDAPLVLTYKLIPSEVDDMVFNLDIVNEYPLEFYESALKYAFPKEVQIKTFASLLGKKGEYGGLGFTHGTSDINSGVRCSAYKFIPTMMEKVQGQMDIAEKIRAVDEMDVARLVIERHFIRDIRGNLRKFSMQQFRCVDCNSKYRRPPLCGKCLKCGGRIIFTIAEGSIVKYLEPSLELAKKYSLPKYLQQTLELTKRRIESVFGKDKDRQEGLQKWF